jgi:HAE1 family hydrophobic/amphiphilic exporter-1
VNPADTLILVLALTSDTLPLTTVDAYAENILLQKISQISGVGPVGIGGQQKPAIRVQVNPQALAARGVGLEDVRNVISQANVDLPKGTLNSPRRTYTINTNDQLLNPDAYNQLIVAYRNGSPVRVKDVGNALNGPENDLLAAWYNRQRAILLAVQRQPNANVIATVDRIKAMLPQLQAAIPKDIKVSILSDRTQTIRASVSDVRFTLMLTVALVVMVIFLFRETSGRRSFPPSRCRCPDRHFRGTLRVRLQSRQFVVDGAHHRRRLCGRRRRRRDREHCPPSRGRPLADAGLDQGRRRNRLYHRFNHAVADRRVHPAVPDGRLCRAVVPRIAITVSVSLVLAADLADAHPMMCSRLLKPEPGSMAGFTDCSRIDGLVSLYGRGLRDRAASPVHALMVMLGTIVLQLSLRHHSQTSSRNKKRGRRHYRGIADTPFLPGRTCQQAVINTVLQDPAVASVGSQIGAGSPTATLNDGRMFIALKPERGRATPMGDQRLREARPVTGSHSTCRRRRTSRSAPASGPISYTLSVGSVN